MKLSAKYFSKMSLDILEKQVLPKHYEYDLWTPGEPVKLRKFQEEVAGETLSLLKDKDVVSVEVFCAGGKTITSAFIAEPYLRQGKKIVFISPKRDAFPHFENEFKRVLHTLGMNEDIVHARNSTTGVSAWPVDKQVLIVAPYDIVAPFASEGERKVINETLKQTGLVIVDEVHRIPSDPENETKIIGRVEPIIRNAAMTYGSRVLTMTGTHFRMDEKPPFGMAEPNVRRTCQDLVSAGCLPNLHGFPVPIEIEVKKGDVISVGPESFKIDLARKRLSKYMGKVADVILQTVKLEAKLAKERGAAYPAGHAIFVSRQKEATMLCDILNKRIGRTAFVAYVSDEVPAADRQEVLERLRDGRLLGYATVMMGAESLDVPRLKYCHLVARVTSGNKLMQALGRVMRLPPPNDADCIKVKDKAIIVDYQVRKRKILRLAMGLRDVARIGGSTVKPEDMLIGGSIFKPRKDEVGIESLRLGEEEAWLVAIKEGPNSAEKKRLLLAMPEGSPRPRKESLLGSALHSYTTISGTAYDAEFDKAITAKQPPWFISSTATNKKLLLSLSKGSPRPNVKNDILGPTLCRLTCKSTNDPEFNKTIRDKQPPWFVRPIDNKKKLLLSIPRNSPKPHYKHTLGVAFRCYCRKYSTCYDNKFSKVMADRQPLWFNNSAYDNKKKLLAMPKGSPRPSHGKLCSALGNYCSKTSGCYDAGFLELIVDRQPQWFRKRR